MNDPLSPLLRHFPLNVGPIHPAGVSPTASTAVTGWLYLLLRGPVQIAPHPPVLQPALLWLPAPTAHTLRPLSDDSTTVWSAPVDFGDPALNPLIAALPALCVRPVRKMPQAMATPWMLLVSEIGAAACAQREVLVRLAEVLLLMLLRQQVEQAQGQVGLLGALSDDRLRRVLNAVHAQPGAPWTLETLAAEAGWSRTMLATRFRAAVGVPPGDYLTDWRLRVARLRLAQGWAVKDVAEAVGYRSAAALSRVCAQRLGSPPTLWRSGGR